MFVQAHHYQREKGKLPTVVSCYLPVDSIKLIWRHKTDDVWQVSLIASDPLSLEIEGAKHASGYIISDEVFHQLTGRDYRDMAVVQPDRRIEWERGMSRDEWRGELDRRMRSVQS